MQWFWHTLLTLAIEHDDKDIPAPIVARYETANMIPPGGKWLRNLQIARIACRWCTLDSKFESFMKQYIYKYVILDDNNVDAFLYTLEQRNGQAELVKNLYISCRRSLPYATRIKILKACRQTRILYLPVREVTPLRILDCAAGFSYLRTLLIVLDQSAFKTLHVLSDHCPLLKTLILTGYLFARITLRGDQQPIIFRTLQKQVVWTC
jgi:hypothetical protein